MAGADGGVRDVDRGLKALLQRITPKAVTPAVEVGVLEGDGEQQYADSEATVLDVATWNEFGTEDIPARSFLRGWADENESANVERMRRIGQAVMQGKLPSVEAGLARFGVFAVGSIQKRIADGISPENAPSTVARKGSSTPLIDTGQLRSSITYRVPSK